MRRPSWRTCATTTPRNSLTAATWGSWRWPNCCSTRNTGYEVFILHCLMCLTSTSRDMHDFQPVWTSGRPNADRTGYVFANGNPIPIKGSYEVRVQASLRYESSLKSRTADTFGYYRSTNVCGVIRSDLWLSTYIG